VKAIILALILIDAVVMALGISGGSWLAVVGTLAAAPSLLYLLLGAIPKAERKVDEMLQDDDH
jgi:hypothetical protein